MATPKKITKTIVRFDHRAYVFDSISQAADAIKFFGKLKPVDFSNEGGDGRYHYRPSERGIDIEIENNREFREKPQLVGLPAPKRGTVLCAMCESVSVRPGSACESCGTIAPLL